MPGSRVDPARLQHFIHFIHLEAVSVLDTEYGSIWPAHEHTETDEHRDGLRVCFC